MIEEYRVVLRTQLVAELPHLAFSWRAGDARTYVCANSSKTGKPKSPPSRFARFIHTTPRRKNVVQRRVFVVDFVVVVRRRIVGDDGTIAIASTRSSSGCGIGAHAGGEPRGAAADDGGSKAARRTSNGGSSVRDWWCRLERWDR